MLGYLSANIMCPRGELFSRAKFEETYCELMSKDKSLNKSNGGYCVYYPSNIFLQHARFENWIFLSGERSSSDAFRPIGRKQKHLIDYILGYMLSDIICFEKRTVSRH